MPQEKAIHGPSGTQQMYTRKRSADEIVDAAAMQRAGGACKARPLTLKTQQ